MHKAALKDAVEELTPIAGGDPESQGKLWTGDVPLDQWSSWTDLVEHSQKTLFTCSKAGLKTKLASSDAALASLQRSGEVLGTQKLADASELETLIRTGYVTKFCGTVIRILAKPCEPTDKAQVALTRTQLIQEVKAMKTRLGEDWHFSDCVPKALAAEIANAITMKRKRSIAKS